MADGRRSGGVPKQNVWIDLSAVLVGETFAKKKVDLVKRRIARLKQAVAYTDNPAKFLFPVPTGR